MATNKKKKAPAKARNEVVAEFTVGQLAPRKQPVHSAPSPIQDQIRRTTNLGLSGPKPTAKKSDIDQLLSQFHRDQKSNRPMAL